nr:MAG TPA: hypothetical protein [Caudoviricetes sp.]
MKSIEELRVDYADTYLNRMTEEIDYLDNTFAAFIFLKYDCMTNNNILSLKAAREKIKRIGIMIDAYFASDLEGGTKW